MWVTIVPFTVRKSTNPLKYKTHCKLQVQIHNTKYKSASSLIPRLSKWHCPHLLQSMLPAIDRYLQSVGRWALSSKPAARRCWPMGQTDGRTPDRFIDPAPHTMQAVSKSGNSPDLKKALLPRLHDMVATNHNTGQWSRSNPGYVSS